MQNHQETRQQVRPSNHAFSLCGAIPARALRSVEHSSDRLGLVTSAGYIATMSRGLTEDLGFDEPEDLQGLSIGSLFDHDDRSSVGLAFDAALEGEAASVEVDLAYLSGTPTEAIVKFVPGDVADAVIMTLDWP